MTAPGTAREALAALLEEKFAYDGGALWADELSDIADVLLAAGWAPAASPAEQLSDALDALPAPDPVDWNGVFDDPAAPAPPSATGGSFVCHHCGTAGKNLEDHTCSCPHPDEACPDHPQGFRAAAPDNDPVREADLIALRMACAERDDWRTDALAARADLAAARDELADIQARIITCIPLADMRATLAADGEGKASDV